MTTSNLDNKRYFVRRVTKELIASLAPASEYPAAQDSSGFWGLASKIGDVFKDLLGGALNKEKPESISSYQGSKAGATLQSPFGFFLVVNHQNKITVITDPGKYAPAADAEVFLVADLVGLPLARITGEIPRSTFDSSPGEYVPPQYAINLWIDPAVTAWVNTEITEEESHQARQRVGLFLNKFMLGKNDLTIEEFCEAAQFHLGDIIQRTLSIQNPKDALMFEQAKLNCEEQITRWTGLSSQIFIRPSSQVFRHQITLDEDTIGRVQAFAATAGDYLVYTDDRRQWICQGNDPDTNGPCRFHNELTDSFCGNCGGQKPSIAKEAGQQARRLVTADGDQLVLDLGFVSYNRPNVDTDAIIVKCIEALRPVVRKFPIASFSDPLVITNLASLLNKQLGTATAGNVGEFSIIDYRSGDSDWQLQTRAKIKEQLRDIGSEQAQIEVQEASIALRQAQLVVAKKGRVVLGDELREALEAKKLDLQIELEDAQLDSRQRVEQARLRAGETLDIDNIEREAVRELRKKDREDELEDTKNKREDDISGLDHDMTLEKKVLQHDLEKADANLSFDEKVERMKMARELDKRKEEQRLEIEAAKAKAETEFFKEQKTADNDLRKLQAMAQMDIAQREQFKNMTPAQILAMQATSFKDGSTGAVNADMLRAIAESDATLVRAQAEKEAAQQLADAKEQLLREMLARADKSSEQMLGAKENTEKLQIDLMKSTLAASQDASDRVNKAHEKTADSAEKWNEKSIDAMAKVASAAAGRGAKGEKSKDEKKSKDGDDSDE